MKSAKPHQCWQVENYSIGNLAPAVVVRREVKMKVMGYSRLITLPGGGFHEILRLVKANRPEVR
jgi:hypothetical protein